MGLKDDLIKAKIEGLKLSGAREKDLDEALQPGSPLEIQAEMEKEAIAKFLTEASFKVTELKAPVKLEQLSTPDQPVDLAVETLLGDKAPIIDTLRKVAPIVPGLDKAIEALEDELKKVITPLVKAGATLPGLNLGKDSGGLESTGYVYIGDDPESQESFNVDDEDGQRNFTTVKLFREDIEDLL